MKKSFLVLIFLTLLISVSFAENIDDVLKELKYQKERVKEFEEKEEETKQYQFEYISRSQLIPESKRKLLAFTLDEPAIIPFGSAQNSTYTQHAYQYVFTKIHPYKSRFIMYPYSFSHTIDSTLETFSEGAFFNIDPSDMPDEDDPDNFFNYFLLSDSIDLTKAKALYDGSIAVLRVEDNFNGFDQDLTYEGYYYCDAMRTYLGKWSQCLTYDEWEATNFTYMGATRFLYFTPENIQNNKLSQSYPLFIIPDIIAHSEDVIMDRLNTTGQTNIVNYVNQGGYNCDSFVSGALEFTHRMICFSSKNTDGSRDASVISPYMPTFPVADPGLTIMTRFDPTTSTLSWKDAETGYVTSIPQSGSNYFPMTMHKFVGEGQILLNFGSSVMKSSHYFWFYNMFFAAFARPLLLDIEVSDDLEQIPALETLSLSANHRFRNLYTDGLTDIRFYSFVVYGVEWVGSAPAGCVYGTNYPSPPSTSIDPSKYLNCSATISSVSESDFMLNFHIYDPLVTQAGTSVMLIYNMYTYTDPVTGDSRTYYPGGLYFDAAMAALLRCDYNPDPSAIYPIKGEGNYIDDVLHTENKEDTMALEVVHYAIVPLISPVVDGNEQAIIAHEIDLDWVYYNTRTNGTTGYIYPFEDNLEDYDFLLYPVLAEKHSVLAADWDTPVKIDKDLCTFNETAGLSLSDVQSAMYQTNIESVGTQVKQRYFKDADVYFEHATQRLLVFCDLTTPEGALEFYGSVGAILNPVPGQNYQKTKLLFVRNDIYFYEYEGYPLPEGVENSSYVITIDRYPPDPANCTPGLYNARADILVPGFFDSTQYPGLVANEYSNEILMNCDRIKKFYTDFGSSSDVEVTHYLIPFVDNTTTVDDLMYFQSNGSYEDYPELQFITPHGSTFELDPADTRKGGMLIIQHPSLSFTAGTIPEKAITLSCDQVAVYDINYVSGNRSFIVKFKRGNMPNEAYGKNSQMEVNIENITTSASFNITMAIWSLVYDLEQPAPHETYNYNQTLQIELVQRPCLSFPALKLAFKLRRGQYENESYINPYEFLEPFVRFGIFLQELRAHRTIWGSLEVHPVSDPGLVGRSGGFSTITHVGTSSIPFREYLTTGASQVIPAASETGRVEWTDIWGRRWVQPVRSLFLDVPPIPPPLKNFIMSTTFELMTKSGERLMEWRTDDEVDVFVKLKLLNNYPKYFEITTCENNRYNQYVKYGNLRDRHFTPPDPATLYEGGASDVFIRQGHSAKYGDCFNIIGQTITLSGKVLTDENKTNIALAQLCSEEDYQDYSDSCQQIDFTTLPTISRRPDNSTYVWNYAPLINSYYAPGYIWADMWDLTHVDYDDNPMDKAYKYHMDNNLPNIDKGIIRPHNIIAFPIWKGLGYSVTYDRTYSNPRYASKYGWWTDNLQNRDDTLVAGQNTCNNVSVDKQDSTLTAYGGPGWILINDLQELISNTSGLNIAEEKEKNIYTCMFNRHRIKITGKSKSSYVDNVYQNNVVPVIPSLTKYDDRLTNFDCSSVPDQYTPDNISSVDNRVYTDSARDWLYFASNLRGGAKETINVVYSIKPIEDVLFESLHAKVQDGGRFTYWNPANGPNSFLVVDNPVSTVIATRSDISIYEEVFPASTTTFQSLVLNLLEIYDENEINRKYTDAIWMNHHGFGRFCN
ncbi:hypothetical protein M0811_04241 [Anaeramoeba ignava]|uniref:Uncharacterized protein n=1 Tax=Anaeramoeba ignava TaxID=1746090 RepID=A0A9Q0LXQ1_ANAIG|nr:hypothetical protein M0811_04241 [Anaeramoeba ignava]